MEKGIIGKEIRKKRGKYMMTIRISKQQKGHDGRVIIHRHVQVLQYFPALVTYVCFTRDSET